MKDDDEAETTDLREIRFLKNQYGRLSDPIVLRYQDGLFLPVPGMTNLDRAAREATVEGIFLDGLLELGRQGIEPKVSHTSPDYAIKLFAGLPAAVEVQVRQDELKKAAVRLLTARKIHVAQSIKRRQGDYYATGPKP